MATYLMLGTTDQRWLLPDAEDTDRLLLDLGEAAREGLLVDVTVRPEGEPDREARLHVNPARLGWWAVVDDAADSTPTGAGLT